MSTLSRSQKRNLLTKLKNHPTYGTSTDTFATSTKSAKSTVSQQDFVYEFGNQQLYNNEEDEIDFGSWNPENIPLLKRTVEQARNLGANRSGWPTTFYVHKLVARWLELGTLYCQLVHCWSISGPLLVYLVYF